MPHFMVDDQFHLHPKVTGLIDEHGQKGLAALGFWVLAGSQCQAKLSDGYVREGDAQRLVLDRATAKRLSKLLVDAGLWEEAAGDRGWRFHDFRVFHKLGESVKGERERRRELRDRDICEAVKARDRDTCRYCGRRVSWRDRKSERGATYDHVIPGLAAGASNLVVACRSCNAIKAQRTPEQAGLTLRAAPSPSTRGPGTDLDQDLDPTQVQTNDEMTSPRGRARERAGTGVGSSVEVSEREPERGVEIGTSGEVGPAGLPPVGAVPPPRQRPVPVGSGLHGAPPGPHDEPPHCRAHNLELPCRACTADQLRQEGATQ